MSADHLGIAGRPEQATGQLGGLVSVEATDIATGRADVIVTFGTIWATAEPANEDDRQAKR